MAVSLGCRMKFAVVAPSANTSVQPEYDSMGPRNVEIAHESRQTLKRAAVEGSEDIEAVIRCGTNLAFAEVAAMGEFGLERPIIAINTATYWHALRTIGISDQMDGFGPLLAQH